MKYIQQVPKKQTSDTFPQAFSAGIHKGQGGETLSDVTLPGEQTPFSYDVDYVLGDTVFSYPFEAAF